MGGLELRTLCLKMCADYVREGETDELVQVGDEVSRKLYPSLCKESVAMTEARAGLRRIRQIDDQ